VQEGSKLRGSLGIEGSGMSQQAARRIFHLYLPVYFWILSLMRQHRDKGEDGGWADDRVLGAVRGREKDVDGQMMVDCCLDLPPSGDLLRPMC
jgi:hypothetical protein